MRARRIHGWAAAVALVAGGVAVPAARADEPRPAVPGATPGGSPPVSPQPPPPPAPVPAPPAGAPPAAAGTGLPALLDRALSPDQRAEWAYLEHLGWRFVADAGVSTI